MRCRTCGTRLLEGAVLCGECGTTVVAPRPTLGDTAHHDRRALLTAIAGERPRAVAPPRSAPPPDARQRQATPKAEPRDDAPRADRTPPPVAPPVTPTRSRRPAHAAPPSGEKTLFGLDFSTGEAVRVAGSGLLGRNPAPAEGERFDYLVQLVDPDRSISKTHLEFAVDAGEFWVRDRASANGTRLGDDPLTAVDLAPGQWHPVPRGSRVRIGDQYFDVR
ncbi:MAG: FHA domain-containing protein [Herbiconiux sp.]|nr:FHA domain-containing protein [Herbiconiux sp.]